MEKSTKRSLCFDFWGTEFRWTKSRQWPGNLLHVEKCHTRKNLCIAYTQVNTHAHFFLLHRRHLQSAREPPTWRRLKFISLTPDKPAPALSGTGSEVIKDSWRNRSYSRLSKKTKGTNSNLSNGTTHTHTHTNTRAQTHTHTPWVHVDKFFNKLWLKGSWFYSDSPPSFQTVYWK